MRSSAPQLFDSHLDTQQRSIGIKLPEIATLAEVMPDTSISLHDSAASKEVRLPTPPQGMVELGMVKFVGVPSNATYACEFGTAQLLGNPSISTHSSIFWPHLSFA
jgi:hypothetical protein